MNQGDFLSNDSQNIRKVLVVVGPSGVGKGTLITKIREEFPEKFAFKISHTTRNKRDGEIDGKHYYFITREEFETVILILLFCYLFCINIRMLNLQILRENEFIEYNIFNNNYYGTSKKEIERISKEGKVCLLEMDVNGANQTYNMKYPANFIGLLPPSLEILKQRLIGRGTDSQEVIDNRVNIGVNETLEIEKTNIFNYKIVNNDLNKAYNDFKSYISTLYPELKI